MSENNTYDLVVIGAGPGGYVAAICASRLGLKVALVEKEDVGGLCLNWGCIPSKILLRQANTISKMRHLKEANGIIKGEFAVDFNRLISHSREKVEVIRKNLENIISSNNVTTINGTAKLIDKDLIAVFDQQGQEQLLKAKNILIATGSKPKTLPFLKIDGKRIITSREALALSKLPESLAIVGGGVVGCEMATFFGALGTRITIFGTSQLLPGIDSEISEALLKSFQSRGISVELSARIKDCKVADGDIVLETEGGKQYHSQLVLVAAGVVPRIQELNIETLGISKGNNGFILVDQTSYRTNIPNIFAVGDVIEFRERPHPRLAHVASCEGEIAAEIIANGKSSWNIDYDNIPLAVFTDPEIGVCGLTKEEAERIFPKDKDKIIVQSTPERAMGIAIALDELEGLTKIIINQAEFGRIVGAHIIGYAATERIHVWTAARRAGESAYYMANQVMAHPTFSEVFREALLSLDGRAVHIPLFKQVGRK